MSERLEEINARIVGMKRKSGMPTEVLTFEGWQSVLPIFTKDLEHLQKQAERVQELEEDYEYLSHHYGLETEQNKRYRELFARILNNECNDSDEFADLAEQIALEALEGESDD